MSEPTARTRLDLDGLEARDVPSAAMLDLTARGSAGGVNGALFQQMDARPTGTGVLQSFVRVQALGNTSVEQGYNTDARPLQFNENKSPQFTRSVRVSDLPLIDKGGTLYREIQLDINQKASASKLSLDELRVYSGTSGGLTGYNAATKQLAGMTPVYDLDGGGDAWVKLDARLNTGSGSGDMLFYVPAANLAADGFLYLYSKFGSNVAANGGFEEWSPGTSPSSPPAQAVSGFSGVVLDIPLDGTSFPVTGGILQLVLNGQVVDEVVVGADGTFVFNNVLLDEAEVTFSLVYLAPPGGTTPVALDESSAYITLYAGQYTTGVTLQLTTAY